MISRLLFVVILMMSSYANGDILGMKVANEIRNEATMPNNSEKGRPLPLAASWNTGTSANGYDPDYQITLIEQGHHVLPWFQLDMPEGYKDVKNNIAYYRKALLRCAEMGLPISLISSQWERLLSDTQKYLKLPPSLNPNVVKPDGIVLPMVSPYGPTEAWLGLGIQWTKSEAVKQLQFWYPNPPKVIFISNNEHRKLAWQDSNSDQRFLDKWGTRASDEEKRKAVGQGWITQYRALQTGMRNGLDSVAWKDNSIFIGYDAFGGSAFGRWEGWINYSLHVNNRIEPWPLAWDGASVPYYVNDWNPSTDYTVWSPQIEAMNWVFMLEEAYQLNPQFWFEMSVWDGYTPNQPNDKRAFYGKQGQQYTPERYAGMIKFGMWLLRPRVVREYRGSTDTRAETKAYFESIVRAVDEIYDNQILKRFWRQAELVANTRYQHPYTVDIPAEYLSKHRWYLMDTNIDPERPWSLSTKLQVFSLALVIGKVPHREWLIYVYSPLGRLSKMRLTIPDHVQIEVDASPQGAYYLVRENNHRVNLINETIRN